MTDDAPMVVGEVEGGFEVDMTDDLSVVETVVGVAAVITLIIDAKFVEADEGAGIATSLTESSVVETVEGVGAVIITDDISVVDGNVGVGVEVTITDMVGTEVGVDAIVTLTEE